MVIGIGGASRSGKSRLAKAIKSQLGDKTVNILEQDDFVIPKENIPLVQTITDWEHPASIDFIKFEKAIQQSHKEYEVTIIEGFLVYYDQKINDHIDIKIFLSIDEPTFLMRKVHDQRWGKTPVFYIDHIWKSYLKYGKCEKDQVDYYLDANGEELPVLDINEIIKDHS